MALCLAVSLALTLFWLGFIFSNSLKTGEESGEQSSKVHQVVNQVASALGAKEEISEDTVRKGAHFTEFAVLGFLVCLSITSLWRILGGRRLSRLFAYSALSLPVCALLAAVDEYLQTFSDGRSAEVADALLDTAGAFVGLLAFVFLAWILWRIVQSRSAAGKN